MCPFSVLQSSRHNDGQSRPTGRGDFDDLSPKLIVTLNSIVHQSCWKPVSSVEHRSHSGRRGTPQYQIKVGDVVQVFSYLSGFEGDPICPEVIQETFQTPRKIPDTLFHLYIIGVETYLDEFVAIILPCTRQPEFSSSKVVVNGSKYLVAGFNFCNSGRAPSVLQLTN